MKRWCARYVDIKSKEDKEKLQALIKETIDLFDAVQFAERNGKNAGELRIAHDKKRRELNEFENYLRV